MPYVLTDLLNFERFVVALGRKFIGPFEQVNDYIGSSGWSQRFYYNGAHIPQNRVCELRVRDYGKNQVAGTEQFRLETLVRDAVEWIYIPTPEEIEAWDELDSDFGGDHMLDGIRALEETSYLAQYGTSVPAGYRFGEIGDTYFLSPEDLGL